jgi:stage III sporulation protein AF
MDILSAWLQKLVGTALVMGFLELIIPEGDLHRFARVVMGLLVVFVLLEPLAGIFHQNLGLERAFQTAATFDAGTTRTRDEQAARVTAAGLGALAKFNRDGMERSIAAFCSSAAGVAVDSVSVCADGDGRLKVTVRLHGAPDPSRVKEMLMSEYGLGEDAIEVGNDG